MLSSESAELLTIDRYLALFGGERRVERELGHADDAVQRRPDLVAHVGEELALRLVRFLGDARGVDQLHRPVANLAVEILGERAQLRVEALALDERLLELPVRLGEPALHAVDVGEQRRNLRRRIRGQRDFGLAAVRRDVPHDADDLFERPRHAPGESARAEHGAAEGEQHQAERERVIAGRLQPDVGERLLDVHAPAGPRHQRRCREARRVARVLHLPAVAEHAIGRVRARENQTRPATGSAARV